MISGIDINEFLRSCRTIALTTENAFERSAFVPTSDDIGSLPREILNKIAPNSSSLQFKLTLSGVIVPEKKSEKKQSYCSEFNQMMKNIVGLIGFEFSKFLEIHMGTFAFIKIILKDMEDAESYKELENYTTYIYRLLKTSSKCTYKFAKPKNGRITQLLSDDGVATFFENVLGEIRKHISSKNITSFIPNKEELINKIADFLDDIVEGNKIIENVDELVIPHMGDYAVVYDGSFIKIFEVLYKSVNADNKDFPYLNDNATSNLISSNVVERFINEVVQLPTKKAENYLSTLEHYFSDVYKMTQEAMLDDPEILSDVKKMNVQITFPLTTLLAKISLCVLARIAMLMDIKKESLMLTSTPSRTQFQQVQEAFRCLVPGLDVYFTLEHKIIIYYILSCLKVSTLTKQKKKSKEETK